MCPLINHWIRAKKDLHKRCCMVLSSLNCAKFDQNNLRTIYQSISQYQKWCRCMMLGTSMSETFFEGSDELGAQRIKY